VLVLDEGRLVEHGTQDELRARGGLFSELWNAQLGSPTRDAHVVALAEPAEARIAELARALAATSDADRRAARQELAAIDRNDLIAWARDALRSGAVEEASLAARLAEGLGLSDVAVDLLERAASLPAEVRAPLIDAFRSFAFDQESMVPS